MNIYSDDEDIEITVPQIQTQPQEIPVTEPAVLSQSEVGEYQFTLDADALPSLILEGLKWYVSDNDLIKLCDKLNISDLQLNKIYFSEHLYNGKSKGICYLQFKTKESSCVLKQWFEKNEFPASGGRVIGKYSENKLGNPFRLKVNPVSPLARKDLSPVIISRKSSVDRKRSSPDRHSRRTSTDRHSRRSSKDRYSRRSPDRGRNDRNRESRNMRDRKRSRSRDRSSRITLARGDKRDKKSVFEERIKDKVSLFDFPFDKEEYERKKKLKLDQLESVSISAPDKGSNSSVVDSPKVKCDIVVKDSNGNAVEVNLENYVSEMVDSVTSDPKEIKNEVNKVEKKEEARDEKRIDTRNDDKRFDDKGSHDRRGSKSNDSRRDSKRRNSATSGKDHRSNEKRTDRRDERRSDRRDDRIIDKRVDDRRDGKRSDRRTDHKDDRRDRGQDRHRKSDRGRNNNDRPPIEKDERKQSRSESKDRSSEIQRKEEVVDPERVSVVQHSLNLGMDLNGMPSPEERDRYGSISPRSD